MKKTLALLTLSLLMIASLIIGVNATISDVDIGFYVRFDSQEKVEQYAYGNSMYIVYDSDVNALRFSSKVNIPTTSTTDWNFYLNFGKNVDFEKYPYMRITYMSPKTGINGEATASKSNVYLYPGNPTADFQAVINMNTGKDSWHKTLVNWNNVTDKRTNGSKDLGKIRMDFPKGIAGYYEFYIYDVGFFATQEAAYSYKPEQSFAMIDFSDPYYATDAAWKNKSGYTLEYDTENEALKFLNTNVTADAEGENGDRIRGQAFSPLDYFSASQYNFVSTKYKTNDGWAMYFLHTGYYMPTDATYTGSGTGIGVNATNNLSMTKSETEWKIASGPLGLSSNDLSKTVVQFFADVINDNGTQTQDKWRTVKYVAYYKTAAEAALETQPAPKNLVAAAPTAKDGKGTISGVTTAMEYRVSDSAYNAYTAITEDGVLEVDAGKTYYIRYASKEGYNAGYAAAVSVPMYWNLDITAVKYSDGETVNATITKTDNQTWTITVPKGTNLTKLVPVYTFESGASEKYKNNANGEKSREASLWISADNSNAEKLVSGTTAFGDNFENNAIQLHIYQTYSLFDVVNIMFAETEVDDTDVVNEISKAIQDVIVNVDGENVTLTNYGHNILLAKASADDIATVIQHVADKYTSRYSDVTATVTVSDYKAFTAGTVDNTEGTDGSCVVSWTVTKGEASANFSKTLPVPAAHYRIILNFGSPILESSISYLGNPESTTYLTGEMVEDDTSLLGRNLKLVKHTTNAKDAEFNITFTPGDGVIPEIEQLADYPVVVYRHENSRDGGRYQIFYYTDGYSGGHAYQDKAYNAYGQMTTNIYEVPFAGNHTDTDKLSATKTDTRWANKLTSIRFDFMRGNLENGDTNQIWSEIDYIGFFATKADAESFVANATLDYADETQASIDAKYKTQVDALKAKEEENGTTVNVSCEEFDLENYGTFKASIKEYVNNYVKNTYFANDNDTVYYVAISDVVRPISGTEENPLGTNGGCTFRIYFADSATNGYAASTGNAITVNVLADDALNVTTLGAQIRADKTDEVSLRFGVQVDKGGIITAIEKDKNLYENLGLETVEGVSDLKFGMLIIPKFALSDNSLTFANLEEKTVDEKTTYWLGNVGVANVECVVIYDSKETDFTYTAVVYGIKDKTTELVARPYAKYTVDGVEKVVYFDAITRSYNSVSEKLGGEKNTAWDTDSEK